MGNLPVNAKTLEEALQLSENILTAIELETASLSSCMLKASRLARLLNDFDYQQIFMYEYSGYPTTSEYINSECINKESVVDVEGQLTTLQKCLELEVGENARNRQIISDEIVKTINSITKHKAFLYEYVSNKYYELKYAKTSTDIFSRTRLIVDDNI